MYDKSSCATIELLGLLLAPRVQLLLFLPSLAVAVLPAAVSMAWPLVRVNPVL